MDFDSAYIDPLLDEWVSFLHEKSKELEKVILEKSKFFIPIIGLRTNDVKLIFNIIEQFKFHRNAKYLAVHLFEKYINFKIWETCNTVHDNVNPNYISKREAVNNKPEIKLRLLSCIQIASKMDSNEDYLKISHIKNMLRKIDPDRHYSNKIILDSEFYVFKSVEFEMPTYTPKSCVDVLLAASGLRNTLEIAKSSSRLLDLSYICNEELYSNLRVVTHEGTQAAFLNDRSALLLKSDGLFLGASIIFSSVFFINMEKKNLKELLKKVAFLVELKETDIWDMANLLFNLSCQRSI